MTYITQQKHLDWTKHLHKPPGRISYKGNLDLLSDLSPSIAVIGSRCMTTYGQTILNTVIPGLVRAGITIVSGGAFGIDVNAQQIAMLYGGKVITVLGNGISNPAPTTNKPFFDKVANYPKGLILSEYEPEQPASRYSFPERNRIISALSDLILIVEARDKSGSLITAQFGLDQSKIVAAFPGRTIDPLSKGTNDLIKQGAHMVTCTRDILELLPFTKRPKITDPIQQTLDKLYS